MHVLLCTASAWWHISASELLGGVVAGLLASGIAWGIGRGLRWKRNGDDFAILAGDYKATLKASDADAGTVAIRGHGPTLTLDWTYDDGSQVSGKIVMNEQSRVTGSASYEHTRGADHGWGYLLLHVASRDRGAVRLLVDGTFTSQESRQQVASAWVWEMQAAR